MSAPTGEGGVRALPANPSLEHLKNEAKQRLRALRSADLSARLADAQLQIARDYGFTSWRRLKAHVDERALAGSQGLHGVLILNDNVTPMQFVVEVLEKVFNQGRNEASALMLGVHEYGRGLCGVYSFSQAEALAGRVRAMAEARGFPLACVVEPAERIAADVPKAEAMAFVVVLVNDDPDRMDFAAQLLEQVFRTPPPHIPNVLVRLRKRGWAFCGPRTRREAERIRDQVAERAAAEARAVRCVLEPMRHDPAEAPPAPIEDRLGLPRVVYSQVEGIIRFDGPAASGPGPDAEHMRRAPAAFRDLVMLAHRKLSAQNCLERMLMRVEQDRQHHVFSFDPNLLDVADPTVGVDLARDIGFIAGSPCSLFKLIRWIGWRDPAGLKVVTDGAVTTLRDNDGEALSVSSRVHALGSDPAVIELLWGLTALLARGDRTLSFLEADVVVETLTRRDFQSVQNLKGRGLETPAND